MAVAGANGQTAKAEAEFTVHLLTVVLETTAEPMKAQPIYMTKESQLDLADVLGGTSNEKWGQSGWRAGSRKAQQMHAPQHYGRVVFRCGYNHIS